MSLSSVRPVLIAGGGPVGVIAALALARQGIPVHVFEAEDRVNDAPRAATTHAATLEMLDEIGSDIGVSTKQTVLHRLQNAGIEMATSTRAQEITDRGVRATRNNSTQVFEADTVVLAAGFAPNTGLAEKLAGKFPTLYSIGDCVEPRKIVDAIDDGARVGREV